jgi:hypothetical protein
MFKSVNLNDHDLARLDDGQGWWKAGDNVDLGGYLPDDENDSPSFDLCVSGKTHDHWMTWADMPKWLKLKFTAGRPLIGADHTHKRTFTLTNAEYAQLQALDPKGKGNATRGLRELLKRKSRNAAKATEGRTQ